MLLGQNVPTNMAISEICDIKV